MSTPQFHQKAEPYRFYQLRWPLTVLSHDPVSRSSKLGCCLSKYTLSGGWLLIPPAVFSIQSNVTKPLKITGIWVHIWYIQNLWPIFSPFRRIFLKRIYKVKYFRNMCVIIVNNCRKLAESSISFSMVRHPFER